MFSLIFESLWERNNFATLNFLKLAYMVQADFLQLSQYPSQFCKSKLVCLYCSWNDGYSLHYTFTFSPFNKPHLCLSLSVVLPYKENWLVATETQSYGDWDVLTVSFVYWYQTWVESYHRYPQTSNRLPKIRVEKEAH